MGTQGNLQNLASPGAQTEAHVPIPFQEFTTMTSGQEKQTQTKAHTPLPWRVREHPENPEQFHVSAQTPEGHPYFGVTKECEIMSDEDYPTKRGDAELIVRACNAA